MKRIYALLLAAAILLTAGTLDSTAQTQKGVMKTKGRMVNGQLQPGTKLGGAIIAVRGRSAVLSQGNGSFSFPVSGQTFMLDSVRKKGYQLVDAEAAPKSYAVSKDPLYVLMETPEQQMQDKLNAERKIRRTLQRQLQEREDEIEALKESNRITEEEYRQQLQQLYQSQENNEKLIADMAKRYSEMDFDQLDSLNRLISDAILNGRLTEADSLLRTKGDINDRIAEVKRAQQAEAQEEEELTRRQSNLEASKSGTRKKLEDLAEDCYKYAELCKILQQLDSATHYLELRAELDTMNARWQFDAGYSGGFSGASSELKYYNRVLQLTHDTQNNYSLYLYATATYNIGVYYERKGDTLKAEKYMKEGILERIKYAERCDNPNEWNHAAWSLTSLGNFYTDIGRYEESEQFLRVATKIYELIAPTYYSGNEFYYGRLYDKWGWLYLKTDKLVLSDSCYSKAWILYSINYANDSSIQKNALADMKHMLKWGITPLYNRLDKKQELIGLYKELCSKYSSTIFINPRKLGLEYNELITDLNDLCFINKNYKDCLETLEQAVSLLQKLSKENPLEYNNTLTLILGNLSYTYIFLQGYHQSEQYAREGLAVDSTQHWIATNLAHALLFQGKKEEAEVVYRQYKNELKDGFLNDFRLFAEAGVIPKKCEAEVERIKKMLKDQDL